MRDFGPVAILLMLAFFIGCCLGNAVGVSASQRQAIKAGVAEWVPDERGSPEFKWRSK